MICIICEKMVYSLAQSRLGLSLPTPFRVNYQTLTLQRMSMRRKKKLRVLIAKFGEGYEDAMLKLAHDCCEAGFEVIYAGLSDPEVIAVCALQESVDHIGITTLPGATVEDFAKLFDMMKKKGLDNVRVTAGGIFPEQDVEKVKLMGVIDFYAGSSIYDKMERWTAEYGGVQDTALCAKFEPALAGTE